jgi:Fur family zinc uptake transcriptional regulator
MVKTQSQTLTDKQQRVLNVLQRSEAPLGAYALLDELREDGFKAPLQIYRALDKLQECGLVHKLDSLNAYMACTHEGCRKHRMVAFMICKKCGLVEELSKTDVSKEVMQMCQERQFQMQQATLEMHGLCEKCMICKP